MGHTPITALDQKLLKNRARRCLCHVTDWAIWCRVRAPHFTPGLVLYALIFSAGRGRHTSDTDPHLPPPLSHPVLSHSPLEMRCMSVIGTIHPLAFTTWSCRALREEVLFWVSRICRDFEIRKGRTVKRSLPTSRCCCVYERGGKGGGGDEARVV